MKKGQESMPIQLLLGVTILTFVLVIGFYSYKQVCASQYEQKVKAGLNNLARTMEQAYQGGIGTSPPSITIDTQAPSGCGVNLESVRIVDGTATACEEGIGKKECAIAVAVARTDEGTMVTAKSFIDIPGGVSITMKREGSTIGRCTDQPLEDIYEGSFDSTEDCGWTEGIFHLKIKKESKDKIVIEEVGA